MASPLRSALARLLWVIAHGDSKGDDLTYRRQTESNFDPVSQRAGIVFEDTAVRGVIAAKPVTGFAPNAAQATVIIPERALVGDPNPGDRIVWRGLTYRVTAVERICLGTGYRFTGEVM